MNWQDCAKAFYVDGSLRDIYVRDTRADDWDVFLGAVSSKMTASFVDGEPYPLPTAAKEIFSVNATKSFLLEIRLGQVIINCHFFTEVDIELDIDPSQVTSQAELDSIVEVIELVGRALGKDVVLTDENSPSSIWFAFDAVKSQVRFVAD
jgi:hypothetical protein